MRPARFGLSVVLASACRIGGPSGDPAAPVDLPIDAAGASDADAAQAESGGDDALAIEASTDATSNGEASLDASRDSSTRADANEGGAACMAPSTDAGACNPVTSTGCALGQCDIDTNQTTPTGICVIASPFPNDAGSPCTQVSGSVSCQPKFTCFGGTCQKVCFCNADCDSGTCCSGSAGTTGFGLCGACQ